MRDEEMKKIIRREIDTEFSDLHSCASLESAIMSRIEGERSARRHVSATLVFAVVMVLALGSMAVAAGLGLFGQLRTGREDETSYARLERLENAAVKVGKTEHLTVGGTKHEKPETVRDALLDAQIGRTYDLTMEQAYCDGRKLYYAYTLRINGERLFMGEGEATGFASWDAAYPDERFEDGFDLGLDDALNEKVAQWLRNCKSGYVVKRSAYVGDGVELKDGTNLTPVDSGSEDADEQTIRAYCEVELPEGYQAGDTVEFVLTVITCDTVYAQNESGFYEATLMNRAAMLRVPVSVPVTGQTRMLKGEGTADGYAAQATLVVSDVDLSGEVSIDAPKDYVPEGYTLLADGVEYPNIDEWMEYDGQKHVIHLRFDLPDAMGDLVLMPVDPRYAEEAIHLN